jgi:hypothetical protein
VAQQIVTIEQAALNAITSWLQSQLDNAMGEAGWAERAAVFADWPNPKTPLAARTVTVLVAGAVQTTLVDPHVTKQVNASATKADYTWRVGVARVQLQVDVWAKYDAWMKDLVARVREAAHKGDGATFGAANADPVTCGFTVALADGWEGHAYVELDGPEYPGTPDSEQRQEYRALFRGWCDVNVEITARSPRLATLKFKQKLHESTTAPSTQKYETTTVTASTESGTVPDP